jgi:hypothetical protein
LAWLRTTRSAAIDKVGVFGVPSLAQISQGV